MTLFQQLMKNIELLKSDRKNTTKKWIPYKIQPIQDQVDRAKSFAKNFINEDGTLCEISASMLFLEIRNLEQRIDELETELRELRCSQEY